LSRTRACTTCDADHQSALEEQDAHLHVVEQDQVFLLVGDVHAKVLSDDAVPVRAKLLVHELLNISGSSLQDHPSHDTKGKGGKRRVSAGNERQAKRAIACSHGWLACSGGVE